MALSLLDVPTETIVKTVIDEKVIVFNSPLFSENSESKMHASAFSSASLSSRLHDAL